MRKSHIFALALIVLIVAVTILDQFTGISMGKEEPEQMERVSISEIEVVDSSKGELDITYALARIESKKSYYHYKDINYFLRAFFDSVNAGEVSLDIIDEEYMTFMGYDGADLLKPYSMLEAVDYDVTRTYATSGKVIVDLSYREIGSDTRYQRSFSIIENTLADRPFIKVQEIGIKTKSDDYSINLVSKGVFDKYEIYKIDIGNRSGRELVVDDSMYGFNAIKGDNKYYHTLESAKLPYEIVPGEIRSFLIRFDTHNPDEIYVTIDGEELRVY